MGMGRQGKCTYLGGGPEPCALWIFGVAGELIIHADSGGDCAFTKSAAPSTSCGVFACKSAIQALCDSAHVSALVRVAHAGGRSPLFSRFFKLAHSPGSHRLSRAASPGSVLSPHVIPAMDCNASAHTPSGFRALLCGSI